MEILKNKISENIIQIEIGSVFDENEKAPSGSIELDIESQSYFSEVMDNILKEDGCNIIINLINVSYIDSSGLWAIFECHKKVNQNNFELILLNPNQDISRVLEITKLSSKMKIFNSQKDAINQFNK